MKEQQSTTISWVLFWTFWLIYVLTSLGTLGMLFFGFGTVQEAERGILVNAFLVETAIAIFGLFYSVFKLKRPVLSKTTNENGIQSETTQLSTEPGEEESVYYPDRNRSLIENAVYEMRDITGADLFWTGLRNDNNFLEFCLKDYSETWLIQEIPEVKLTGDIRRQIKIVNRHLKGWEERHQKIIIILFINKKVSYDEKAALLNQLQIFHSAESLSPKISFRIWGVEDVERALED